MMTPEHKALVAELRRRAERRVQTEGPFTKENLVEWRAIAAIESLSAQSAQPQAGEAVGHRWRGPDGKWVCSWDRPLMEPTEYAEALYASPQPALAVKPITDEAVRMAGDTLMRHGLNAPEQVIYQAARAVLEGAALVASPQPANPAQVTDAMVTAFIKASSTAVGDTEDCVRAGVSAAIGAGGQALADSGESIR